ncbi:hypothetical protein M6B38_103025 [Iris pallida]|uniref:Uncharacterized protein n=1 Tax=Iris pallida TaxID=29817 RepID=A0AAX6G660_IRIPA|nr:hypothetical protein M6B38_103025 [Iris pallida]
MDDGERYKEAEESLTSLQLDLAQILSVMMEVMVLLSGEGWLTDTVANRRENDGSTWRSRDRVAGQRR